ncbi:MAG: thioredoxin family protein [Bdellovibrionota bacterium]
MSKVIELNDQTFQKAIEAAPLALVDFYANWCGPCRLFSPIFEKVAGNHEEAFFFKIDGDANPQARAELTIDNLPYVAAYKNGRFVGGFSTTMEDALEGFINTVKKPL